MSTDGQSQDNGKGFRMRFKTLNYVPSQCGDKKYQSLASDETIHIRYDSFGWCFSTEQIIEQSLW